MESCLTQAMKMKMRSYISNENDGHHENNFHTWEMHMKNSSNKYLGEHSIQLLVVTRP